MVSVVSMRSSRGPPADAGGRSAAGSLPQVGRGGAPRRGPLAAAGRRPRPAGPTRRCRSPRGAGRVGYGTVHGRRGTVTADTKPSERPGVARIDLHCHSRYSDSSELYLSRAFGLRESYTDPEVVYRLAKARGMTHVTLTDRDTIEGALRAGRLPRLRPRRGGHGLLPFRRAARARAGLGPDEEQHATIQDVRFDIVELSRYLHEQGAALRALAPPSWSTASCGPSSSSCCCCCSALGDAQRPLRHGRRTSSRQSWWRGPRS